MAPSYEPVVSLERRKLCRKCLNKGLIAIRYKDKSPWDIALCDCHYGQLYRKRQALVVVKHPWITPEHQVGWLEDYMVEPKPEKGQVYRG